MMGQKIFRQQVFFPRQIYDCGLPFSQKSFYTVIPIASTINKNHVPSRLQMWIQPQQCLFVIVQNTHLNSKFPATAFSHSLYILFCCFIRERTPKYDLQYSSLPGGISVYLEQKNKNGFIIPVFVENVNIL